ncbi:MAG: efflux RND transporter permease subunit [Clostridia bacterium]|nr:efflux RND transporter permease subunit [Clostridia bacterium]
MKVTEFSIKRSAGMTMIIMLFIVLGLVGYSRLGADLFPRLVVPFVTVITAYPGAGAQEIETQVVDPIEEAVSSLSGLDRVVSVASEGFTSTLLEFKMGSDINVAANDTQKAIDAIMAQLPKDIVKPVVQKMDLNAEAIMTLAVSGDLSLTETYGLAKDRIKQRLETVPGVAKVTLQGGREREIQVNVNRSRLEAYGLSINQIVNRLKLENYNVPSGRVTEPKTEYTVRLLGQFSSIEEIMELRIPLEDGSSVPLRELAEVTDAHKEVRQYSRKDDREAVGILIQKQSDASIVDTAEAVKEEVDKIRKTLPKGVNLVIAIDASTFIKNSLADTRFTLFEGVLMTGLILIIFLREWRSLLIVMLAIPTSIIATFMMMYFFGYSFNLMSLLGLTLCVGILVDDSIVVLENIHRHLKMGKNPIQAVIDGRREVGMAAVAITLADVVVFLPIAFMDGMIGSFFRQFGLTVVFAALFSLFISFTLTPMLAAKFFKKTVVEKSPANVRPKPKTFLQLIMSRFDLLGAWVAAFYQGLLRWSLGHRWTVLGLTALALAASISLYATGSIGAGFIAKTDSGRFFVALELTPGNSLAQTDETLREVEAKLKQIKEVEHYYTTVGIGGMEFISKSGSHLGRITVVLKPKEERQRTIWEVTDEVRAWGKHIPAYSFTVNEAGLPVVGNEAPIQVEVTGPNLDTLVGIAAKVEQVVKSTSQVNDVTSSWQGLGQPEIRVKIDRLRVAEHGLSVGEIAQALRTAMEGEVATLYRDQGKEYDLRVRLRETDRATGVDLAKITLTNNRGQLIQLNQVAEIGLDKGPTEIRHKNRDQLITITATTTGAVGAIADNWDKIWAGMGLPPGYEVGYYGEIKDQRDTFADMLFVMILALTLVYIIMVILYESYLTPFIRMLSLPCSLIGALAALAITGYNLDMMSFIALIMLEGLAAKNGTLLIDYTNTLMARGMSLRDALMEAGVTRLRPIFMTSFTMIFGMLPTALALSDGAELRKGIGLVIIGGMVTSTILTPIIIPVAYTMIDDFKQWFGRLVKPDVRNSGVDV